MTPPWILALRQECASDGRGVRGDSPSSAAGAQQQARDPGARPPPMAELHVEPFKNYAEHEGEGEVSPRSACSRSSTSMYEKYPGFLSLSCPSIS